MPKKDATRTSRVLRGIAMCYMLLIIPALFVYGGMRLFTDLWGKALFNSFLPAILVIVIIYLYYLIQPLRWFGTTENQATEAEASHAPKSEQGGSGQSDSHIQNID